MGLHHNYLILRDEFEIMHHLASNKTVSSNAARKVVVLGWSTHLPAPVFFSLLPAGPASLELPAVGPDPPLGFFAPL